MRYLPEDLELMWKEGKRFDAYKEHVKELRSRRKAKDSVDSTLKEYKHIHRDLPIM